MFTVNTCLPPAIFTRNTVRKASDNWQFSNFYDWLLIKITEILNKRYGRRQKQPFVDVLQSRCS